MAQVETERQEGTGVEVICSQFEVTGPVVEVESVPVVAGPVVNVRDPVVALIAVESVEVLSLVVQAVTVKVSAIEATGPAFEVEIPLKTGSVDEVKCSVIKLLFFAILSVASVTYVGSDGLVGLVSEVIVSVVESIGPLVKVGPCRMDPVLEATDSAVAVPDSALTSLWLSAP